MQGKGRFTMPAGCQLAPNGALQKRPGKRLSLVTEPWCTVFVLHAYKQCILN